MRILLLVFLFLLISFPANAETEVTLKFTWDKYPDEIIEQQEIEGVHIYKDNADNLVSTVEANINVASVDTQLNGCHNFFARGFNKTEESQNSDIVTVCEPNEDNPEIPLQPPVAIGGFVVEVIVKPTTQ